MQEILEFRQIDEEGPLQRTLNLPMSAEEIDREEMPSFESVRLEVEASSGDLPGEYLIDGTIEFTAELRCGRCLDPFPFANRSSFTLRYRPRPETAVEDQEIEVLGEDLELDYYTEPVLSFRDVAREQVQLSIPMKPLCDLKCAGLCPTCGVNLNRESCTCTEPQSDERFAALRDFRDQLARKKEN